MYIGIYKCFIKKTDRYIYNDINEVYDWAKKSSNVLYYNNIIKRIKNYFLTKERFIHEQSIVYVYRL